MTPVEERIDHDRAKRTAEIWASPSWLAAWPNADTETFQNIARAYLDLLTEHSTHEELALENVLAAARSLADRGGSASLSSALRQYDLARLPATESAQPEEER